MKRVIVFFQCGVGSPWLRSAFHILIDGWTHEEIDPITDQEGIGIGLSYFARRQGDMKDT
jgi:hypothetical protein